MGRKLQVDWEFNTEKGLPMSLVTLNLRWGNLTKKFSDLIKSQSIKDSFMLDIGGGTGQFYSFIKDFCKLYAVCEPSLKQAEKFLSCVGKYFCVGCGEHLPYKDNTFDAVIIKAALDHCIDPLEVISESHRILKDKAKIFILLTNEGAWYKRLLRGYSRKRRMFCSEHNFYFSAEEISKMLEKTGFGNIKLYHYDFLRLPIAVENFLFYFIPRVTLNYLLTKADKLLSCIFTEKGGSFICVASKVTVTTAGYA